jgi:hypothetical protein
VLERPHRGDHLGGEELLLPDEDPVEGLLAGVTERGVPEVVTQRRRLHEVLVEAEGAGDGPPQLRHLEGVGEAGPGVVGDVGHEDLGLVLETTKGPGVGDPVSVALERQAVVRP